MADTKYVEISVMISDMASYDINIPSHITPETFPEVMKRLKAIQGIIPVMKVTAPQKALGRPLKTGAQIPILKLGIEESEDIIKKYQSTTPRAFNEFLKEKYGMEERGRANISSVIARMRKRIYNLKARREI